MINLGPQKSTPLSTYRCGHCRALMKGPEGRARGRCPLCETGALQAVPRVTDRMLAAHERAR